MKNLVLSLLLIVGFIPTQVLSQEQIDVDKLLFAGKYSEAIPMLKKMIAKDSLNNKLYFRLGKSYQHLNQYQFSIENYKKACKLNENSIATRLNLSSCLFTAGQYPQVEKEIKKIKVLDSLNYQANMLLAKTYSIQNKHKKSLETYQLLVELDSLNPYVHKLMGACRKRTQDYVGSLSSYLVSYRLNQNDLTVTSNIIQILYEMTGYQQALEYANKGLATYPNNSMLLKKKAQVLIGLEWFENALNILKELKSKNQLSEAEHKQLGICYMQTRLYNEALTAFSIFESKYEKDPMVKFYQGVCNARLEKHELGVKLLEEAIFYVTPTIEASMHLYLAKSYGVQRQFEKSIASYKRHFELDNSNLTVLYEIATTYEEYGNNKKKALNYYTKYVQKSEDKDDPKYEYAKARILRLKENIHFEK